MLAEAEAEVPRISPDEAKGLLGRADVLFLDVREPAEVATSGKVPGALAVPRGLVEFRADPASAMHDAAFDRAKTVMFATPHGALSIVIAGAKKTQIHSAADLVGKKIGITRATLEESAVPGIAPPGTNIVFFDDIAATIQALLSGQVQAIGGNMFYVQRLNQAKPDAFEDKLEFARLYNGACTRLGEKEINAAANAFIDKIRSNGELAKVYAKWMKVPVPTFRESVEGIPFVAS